MKKISLLLLSLFVLSCVQEEIVQDTMIQQEITLNNKEGNINIKKSSSTTSKLSVSGYNSSQILEARTRIYTYALGRTLRLHFQSTSLAIQHASIGNIFTQSQTTTDFNQLINKNTTFKTNFSQQLHILRQADFGYNEINPEHRVYPRVGDRDKLGLYRAVIEDIMNEIANRSFYDSIEIFTVRQLILSHYDPLNQINCVTPHPFNENNFANGYVFTSSITEGNNNNAVFDDAFLVSHPNNVLVVRPYRDATHSYGNIDVVDFTTYYSN